MVDAASVLRAALADRYTIDRELGQGGMSIVYLARDLRHDRLVALKILRPELALALGADRFLREIRVTAGLRHPNILPLFDSGETEGILWYTAPFVEGESLRARLDREGMLPVDDAIRLGSEVADALAHAHAAGVVHRDIKPGNILLLGDHALVADFGISQLAGSLPGEHLTQTGLSIGTPGYMSPEQATGGHGVDHRSDIYSLGVVLYEMLAGAPPFAGPSSKAIIARQLTGDAPRLRLTKPGLPPPLDSAVARALSAEPVDRFQTARELASALTAARASPAPRSRWRVGAIAAAAGAAVLALVWALSGRKVEAPAVEVTDPRVVAVLPFAGSVTDTALERLGRDLVFTLSAAMDGVGDLRTADAHAILAQASSVRSARDANALARRLGAGRVLTGSLVRVGGNVRVDAVVQDAHDSAGPVRMSFTAAPDSVAMLTDSLAQRFLPALLRGGAIPEASLESALRTRSVPALRAYLEGEQLLTESDWEGAIAAYSRARAADSTFWLAASRLVFALEWMLRPVPEALLEGLGSNAASLPPRERLEFAAMFGTADSGVSVSEARFRELVTRYPTSWFGWFAYGDLLLHFGPVVGRPLADAHSMFARTLELDPSLVPAWDHDLMLAASAGDGARLRTGLAALARLGARPEDAWGNAVLSFRLLRALLEGDSAAVGPALDSVVADKVSHGRFAASFYEPVLFGFPRTQLDLVRLALVRGEGALPMDDWRTMEAYSLAAVGAWDSAVAVMPEPEEKYRLAVLGAAAGVLGWDAVSRVADAVGTGPDRLFLDGVTAFSRGDRTGIEAASRRLALLPDTAAKVALEALAHYDLMLRGDTAGAGAGLAALEWRLADRRYADAIGAPSLPALNRWFAARWLRAAGDTGQARRLLLAGEARFLPHPSSSSLIALAAALRQTAEQSATP